MFGSTFRRFSSRSHVEKRTTSQISYFGLSYSPKFLEVISSQAFALQRRYGTVNTFLRYDDCVTMKGPTTCSIFIHTSYSRQLCLRMTIEFHPDTIMISDVRMIQYDYFFEIPSRSP